MTASEEDQARRLTVLLSDYAEARADERQFVTLQGACLTLAITTLSLLFVLAFQFDPPDIVLVIAPMSVVTVLAFSQNAGSQAIDRSFYLRVLERDIRHLVKITPSRHYQEDAFRPFTMAEFMATSATAVSKTHRRQGMHFGATVAIVVFATTWVIFGGVALYVAVAVNGWFCAAMGLVYIPLATGIFRQAVRAALLGRTRFAVMVRRVNERVQGNLDPAPTRAQPERRSLVNYLALPRPDDLVKGLFVFGGGVAALLFEPSPSTLASFIAILICTACVELLVYSARYQWNDIRGIAEDEAAPASRHRGRLPGGVASINASLLVLGLRLYALVVLLCLIIGSNKPWSTPIARSLAIALIGAFLLAVPYEIVRTMLRNSRPSGKQSALIGLLIALVGLGYPLRFFVGWLSVAIPDDDSLYFVAIGMWLFGISFVTMTWFLEAASYTGRFNTPGSPGRWVSAEITRKPHLAALLKWSRINLSEQPPSGGPPAPTGSTERLLTHWRGRWPPVWDFACALAVTTLTIFGIHQYDATSTPYVLASVAGVSIIRLASGRARASFQLALSLALATGAVLTAAVGEWSTNSATLTLTVILPVIPIASSACFRASSYDDLKKALPRTIATITQAGTAAYRIFIGQS